MHYALVLHAVTVDMLPTLKGIHISVLRCLNNRLGFRFVHVVHRVAAYTARHNVR